MADLTKYQKKLTSPKWQKVRLKVLERDEFTCTLCLDNEHELQVHHLFYMKGREPWEYELQDMTTLCHVCHALVTFEKGRNIIACFKISSNSGFELVCIDDKRDLHFYQYRGGCIGYAIGYSNRIASAFLHWIYDNFKFLDRRVGI